MSHLVPKCRKVERFVVEIQVDQRDDTIRRRRQTYKQIPEILGQVRGLVAAMNDPVWMESQFWPSGFRDGIGCFFVQSAETGNDIAEELQQFPVKGSGHGGEILPEKMCDKGILAERGRPWWSTKGQESSQGVDVAPLSRNRCPKSPYRNAVAARLRQLRRMDSLAFWDVFPYRRQD